MVSGARRTSDRTGSSGKFAQHGMKWTNAENRWAAGTARNDKPCWLSRRAGLLESYDPNGTLS